MLADNMTSEHPAEDGRGFYYEDLTEEYLALDRFIEASVSHLPFKTERSITLEIEDKTQEQVKYEGSLSFGTYRHSDDDNYKYHYIELTDADDKPVARVTLDGAGLPLDYSVDDKEHALELLQYYALQAEDVELRQIGNRLGWFISNIKDVDVHSGKLAGQAATGNSEINRVIDQVMKKQGTPLIITRDDTCVINPGSIRVRAAKTDLSRPQELNYDELSQIPAYEAYWEDLATDRFISYVRYQDGCTQVHKGSIGILPGEPLLDEALMMLGEEEVTAEDIEKIMQAIYDMTLRNSEPFDKAIKKILDHEEPS